MTRDEAKGQMKRLTVLVGFPAVAEAAEDMIEAILTANSLELAKRTISSILETAEPNSRCPLAHQVKRLIYDASLAQQQDTYRCSSCRGSRSTVAWYLTTFESRTSFRVVRRELLHAVTCEQHMHAYLRANPLGECQMVITGAVACRCVATRSAAA
ncbi:MAG: hypothetical protein ABI824_15925 [Acidobacteriota bacterium]